MPGVLAAELTSSSLTTVGPMMRQDRTEAAAVFHGLRQQAEKDNSKEPYMCLSDFIAPKVRSARQQGFMTGSADVWAVITLGP